MSTNTRFPSDSRGPAVDIVTWYCMVVSVLTVLTRIATKMAIYRTLTIDDGFILAALVLSIAQVIAQSCATAAGFGTHQRKLSALHLDRALRAVYATRLLTLLALGLSKLAYTWFLHSISPRKLHRVLGWGIIITIIVWTVTSAFAFAFQCRPPRVWDVGGGHCYDLSTFDEYFNATNIAIELVIIGYTSFLAWGIQTYWMRKLTIALIFALRLFVVASTILHLFFYSLDHVDTSRDYTYTPWVVAIIDQITLMTSIVTACSAQFKPVLDSLRTSGMRIDYCNSPYARSDDYGYAMESNPRQNRISNVTSAHRASRNSAFNKRPRRSKSPFSITVDNDIAGRSIPIDMYPIDRESSKTRGGTSDSSENSMIRETRSWFVTEERTTEIV